MTNKMIKHTEIHWKHNEKERGTKTGILPLKDQNRMLRGGDGEEAGLNPIYKQQISPVILIKCSDLVFV